VANSLNRLDESFESLIFYYKQKAM